MWGCMICSFCTVTCYCPFLVPLRQGNDSRGHGMPHGSVWDFCLSALGSWVQAPFWVKFPYSPHVHVDFFAAYAFVSKQNNKKQQTIKAYSHYFANLHTEKWHTERSTISSSCVWKRTSDKEALPQNEARISPGVDLCIKDKCENALNLSTSLSATSVPSCPWSQVYYMEKKLLTHTS